MKTKLFFLSLFLFVFLINISNVSAEVSYDLDYKFMNRSYSQIPFTTSWVSGETFRYNDNYIDVIIPDGSGAISPPRYINVIYCAQLPVQMNTNSISSGNMSNLGYIEGSSCDVPGHSEYEAHYYLNRWNVYSWYKVSSSPSYTNYKVIWDMTVANNSSYMTYQNVQSIFLSNELIDSWHDYGLVDNLINNQNIIKNKLDQIQSALGGNNSILGNINTNTNITKQNTEDIKEKANDIDDTLNNSSVDSSDSTLSNLSNNLATNSVISDLILLPVSMLRGIVNAIDGTCSNFSLGSLYGTNLIMPCINIQNYVGSAIWTFIDLVFSGIFVLVIRKKFIQIFENITNLKGGNNEVD